MNPLGHGPVAEVFTMEGKAIKVFPGKFDRRTLAAVEREKTVLGKLSAPILPVESVGQVGCSSRMSRRMSPSGCRLAT